MPDNDRPHDPDPRGGDEGGATASAQTEAMPEGFLAPGQVLGLVVFKFLHPIRPFRRGGI